MVLIDTSAWIHFLRVSGNKQVRQRVEQHLQSGEAAWCAIVRLELWNGAGGEKERRVLREFEQVLPELPLGEAVWARSFTLARAARSKGISVPATDILIAACATEHEAKLEHDDADFLLLSKL